MEDIQRNQVYNSYVNITKDADINQIFYFEPYEVSEDQTERNNTNIQTEDDVEDETDEMEFMNAEGGLDYILVYSAGKKIKYAKDQPEVLLKRLCGLKNRILHLKMNHKSLKLCMVGYFINKYPNLLTGHQCIRVSENVSSECEFPIVEKRTNIIKMILKRAIRKVKIPMDEIVASAGEINNNVSAEIELNGIRIQYGLKKKKRRVKTSLRYFAPMMKVIRDGLMVFMRRNVRGNIVLVMRGLDAYEVTSNYRFWESRIVSGALYYWGKLVRRFSKQQVNLYFEKESMKAEEGTYEVFSLAAERTESKNYFIINAESEDYDRIKQNDKVVPKYSAKYYWLIYRANNAITTEAPAHVNILRSANKYVRFRMIELNFVFLQHGVTYMKCHGPASAFVKGREAEPEYIFVGSKKERDIVVDMLRLPEERVLIAGLPIFSTISYQHITAESDDYVTIMLTFKPYEERLDNFENSRYYRAILDLYAVLKKYIPEEKILIVAHPRIQYLLETTALKDRMWDRPISQVLEITKLMITDYSSVAYNSFYQGAAVLFYQEDLAEYEKICGSLIPADEEYIGLRAFNLEEFEEMIRRLIPNQRIVMKEARTDEHERNYKSINEFHDGKNVDRIFQKLVELKLI